MRSFAPPRGFLSSPRPAGKSSAPHIPGRWVGIRWKGLGNTFQKIRTSLGQWKLCEGSVNYMKLHKDQHPTHKFSLSLRSYNSTEFVRLFIQSMFQIQTCCTVFNPFKQTPLVAFLANVNCDSSPICCPFHMSFPFLSNICLARSCKYLWPWMPPPSTNCLFWKSTLSVQHVLFCISHILNLSNS